MTVSQTWSEESHAVSNLGRKQSLQCKGCDCWVGRSGFACKRAFPAKLCCNAKRMLLPKWPQLLADAKPLVRLCFPFLHDSIKLAHLPCHTCFGRSAWQCSVLGTITALSARAVSRQPHVLSSLAKEPLSKHQASAPHICCGSQAQSQRCAGVAPG
jgi:hypothetical protein